MPPPIPSPADAARAYMRSLERPILAWLDRNDERVFTLSENAVVSEILRAVPGAPDYGVGATRGVIRRWLAGRGRRLPSLSVTPHPADRIPPTESRPLPIVSEVEDAIEVLTDGVTVNVGGGQTTISVSGVTSQFRLPNGLRVRGEVGYSGDAQVTLGGPDGTMSVGTDGASVRMRPSGRVDVRMGFTWEGEMSFQTRVDRFNFRSTLSRDRWSVRLTFPTTDMPEDVSRLGEVFTEAEAGLREIIRQARTVDDPAELPGILEGLSDQLNAIKRAVSAASSVRQRSPGIQFGIQASGPGFDPSGDAPRESRVMAVLSVSF